MASATNLRSFVDSAFEEQALLRIWNEQEPGQAWYYEYTRANGDLPGADPESMRAFTIETAEQAAVAPPYVLSDDMLRLVVRATDSFQAEPIYPTDLLTPSGYIWLQRPILDDPDYLEMSALAWIAFNDGGWTHHLESATNCAVATFTPAMGSAVQPGWNPTWPKNILSHIGLFPFRYNDTSFSPPWRRFMQVFWRITQQRLAVQETTPPTRPARRRVERMGEPTSDVSVVRLRRRAVHNREPETEGTPLDHRHIVPGHWTNQWYPTMQTHRQLWIEDYVRGPEDAPLRFKDSTYGLVR